MFLTMKKCMIIPVIKVIIHFYFNYPNNYKYRQNADSKHPAPYEYLFDTLLGSNLYEMPPALPGSSHPLKYAHAYPLHICPAPELVLKN